MAGRSLRAESIASDAEAFEARLLARARKLQREQQTLINARKDPEAFGRKERELERIWRQLDIVRKVSKAVS